MRTKLEEKEYNKASEIVQKYRTLEQNFHSVQEELELLDRKKTVLLELLDNIQSEEQFFFDELTSKYGEGKLDLLTFEYVTTN